MALSPTPETLSFRMHPRVFSALGADLVTNDIVAVIELVKNSYDAGARRVDIIFTSKNEELGLETRDDEAEEELGLEIRDDGSGMARNTIADVWCVVATPFRCEKENKYAGRGKRKRRVSGEKGLGRLSAARLGSRLEMLTKVANGPCWKVVVDWKHLEDATALDQCGALIQPFTEPSPFGEHGTSLCIPKLNRVWEDNEIEELDAQLSRLLSPFGVGADFEIWMKRPGGKVSATKISPPEFLQYPPYSIAGTIDEEGVVKCTYVHRSTDEESSAKINRDLWERVVELRKREREKSSRSATRTVSTEHPIKPQAGSFTFEIRAWDIDKNSLDELQKQHGVTRSKARAAIKSFRGISVYRDNILVLPKSPTATDWLGLDLRRVSRIGTRLSTSQIVGYVSISAEGNAEISDTSDRERIVDNQASQDFKDLLHQIIAILEVERERVRTPDQHEERPFRDLFAEIDPSNLVENVERIVDDGGDTSAVVSAVKQFAVQASSTISEIETRFIYYSRLASLGQMAGLIVHEIRHATLVLGELPRLVLELISEGIDKQHDELREQSVMAQHSIAVLDAVADKFSPLASRRSRRRTQKVILEEHIEYVLDLLSGEIKSANIQTAIRSHTPIAAMVDPLDLTPLIFNLVNNAIYWLGKNHGSIRKLEFLIRSDEKTNRVIVECNDSGPGVPDDQEERIFWPGATLRPDGIGMGLTVAAELVSQYGGRLILIKPGRLGGASFRFDLPTFIKS